MNSILKRTSGVLVMIISALVLLTSVAGVFGLWAINGQLHDLTTAIFAPLESGLNTANTALEKVNTHVSNAATRISNAQESVGQLGQNLPGNGAVLGAISDTVGAKLEVEIDEARESVGNVLDLVNGVNNAIVAVNKLPSVNLPTLTEELQAIDTRMTTMGDRRQELRTDLEQIVQGRLQITSSRLNTLLENLDNGLQNIKSVVDKYIGNIQQTQAQLASTKSNISGWITVGWIVATIYLLWIAVSQVLMLMYGWSLFKNKPKDLVVSAAPTAPAGGDLTTTAPDSPAKTPEEP